MISLSLRDVAAYEEKRQARALAEVAAESIRLCGGTVARGAPGVWFNGAVGLGFDGEVSAQDIETLIEYHSSAGSEPRIEVAPFADASLVRGLECRAFVVRTFEMVFFAAIDPEGRHQPVVTPPPGLHLEAIDPDDQERLREYAHVAVQGFFPPGTNIEEAFLDTAIACAKHPRTVALGAFLDGRMVGAGGMEVAENVSGLFGLSVLPEYRCRGIQQAMIAWRLNHAASRGCQVATIGSRPGTGTERNVRRMGFQLAYTKVVLVKPGEGLTPVAE